MTTERGPHKSALAVDAIEMTHSEVDGKVEDGFDEVVYLDKIRELLETPEWKYLKISPISMVLHKSRKYKAILELSFSF